MAVDAATSVRVGIAVKGASSDVLCDDSVEKEPFLDVVWRFSEYNAMVVCVCEVHIVLADNVVKVRDCSKKDVREVHQEEDSRNSVSLWGADTG